MIKNEKSLVALSLGLALSAQGMVVSSALQTSNDSASLSDDDSNINSDTLTRSTSNQNVIGNGNVILTSSNVRLSPSSSSSVIGTLKLNDNVEIIGTSGDWYKIDFNGKEGYVLASHVRLNPFEKGIDVSKWNGNINWQSVKNSGIDYVIIRGGYGKSTVDPNFKTYIEGARNAGLKIGVYWFSYANSVDEVKVEAQKCLQTISPYKNNISYPVFFDFEYESVSHAKSDGVNVTKSLATEMANTFLNIIKSNGYITGIYTNKDFSNTYFSTDLLYSNNLWVSNYASTNTFGKPYAMWQYSEKGKVPGISGNVDLNYTTLKMTNKSNNTTTDTNTDSNNNVNTSTPSSDKGTTTANLNLRSNSSTSSSILATIPKNSSVDIISKLSSGWYKVKYNNNTGYVSSSYIKLNSNNINTSTGTNTSTSTSSNEKGTTTANLNLRSNASTSSSILTTIPKNSSVDIISKLSSGWYKVKYNNKTGYVSSSYIKLNSNNTNTGTVTAPSSSLTGVTTNNLNFRKSTSTSSSILLTIPKNTSVEIVNRLSSGWYKIKYKGFTGYVVGTYIKIK